MPTGLGRVVQRDGVTIVYPGRLPMLSEHWHRVDRALMARHAVRCAEAPGTKHRRDDPGVCVSSSVLSVRAASQTRESDLPRRRQLRGDAGLDRGAGGATKRVGHARRRDFRDDHRGRAVARRRRCREDAILPNGADTDLFVAGQFAAVPDDLARIPRPRLGYAGSLNEKVDFVLVDRIAARRPDWHWVLVGPRWSDRYLTPETRAAIARCERRPNVHFLPTRPFPQLPAYCAHMDVNVLCYRSDEHGWWATSIR